jgi:hypothetical protein
MLRRHKSSSLTPLAFWQAASLPLLRPHCSSSSATVLSPLCSAMDASSPSHAVQRAVEHLLGTGASVLKRRELAEPELPRPPPPSSTAQPPAEARQHRLGAPPRLPLSSPAAALPTPAASSRRPELAEAGMTPSSRVAFPSLSLGFVPRRPGSKFLLRASAGPPELAAKRAGRRTT